MRFPTLILFLATVVVGSATEPPAGLAAIDATIAKLTPHAQNYPPRFSSPAERQALEGELRQAIAALAALVARQPDNPELLLRDGFANSMGHNLDFKGCAPRSAASYEHLLKLKPDDKMANLHYGAFLGGVGKARGSIQYLAKAIELGATEAHYSLAIAYVMLEDREKGIHHLRAYISSYPQAEGAKKLLAALESKNLKIERKEEKLPASQ